MEKTKRNMSLRMSTNDFLLSRQDKSPHKTRQEKITIHLFLLQLYLIFLFLEVAPPPQVYISFAALLSFEEVC